MPIAVFASYFLAQSGMPDSASTVAQAVPLLVGIMALSVFLNQALGALNAFRRLKAPESGTEEKFKKLEADIRDVELRMEKRMGENLGEIKTRLQTLESTLSHVVGDINFALGQMAAASRSNSPTNDR
jgi:hypothetical protein